MKRMLIAVFCGALLLAATAFGAAPVPQSWYWSKERAASVIQVTDSPAGCSKQIYSNSGWVGNCVAANYTYGGADCVGTGPRTVSSTEDVYLYKTFQCEVAVNVWTPTSLHAAYRNISAHPNGIGGAGTWLTGAADAQKRPVRVQVTGRFTAIVTWVGGSWKMTITPSG
jgi:hypothetical protein